MRRYLKPAPGRMVRIPHTDGHLPAVGAYVEDSPYWRRRVDTGDALPASAPGLAETKAKIDAVAGLLQSAIADAAAAGGTVEAGKAAAVAFEIGAAPFKDEALELAEELTPAERAECDIYGAARMGALLAELHAMANGEPLPPSIAKKKAKAAK